MYFEPINRLFYLKPTKMLQIGITGGIGSGKTTVCKIFELLGIPVYYADDQAKRLMIEDPKLIEQVKEIFGNESYFEDGSLHRKHIAGIAFSDPSKLAQLNGAVHPAVARDGIRWNAEQEDIAYTLKEAALLFESGSHKGLDQIICVTAPVEVRIKRVIIRDDVSREAVLARIGQQIPEEEKVGLSDFVIHNDGDQMIIPQILKIHQDLLSIAKQKTT